MADDSSNPLRWHCEFTYKDDARSRVWLASDEQGDRWVIKMFKHKPWRQRLGLIFGLHPGKREKRKHEQLQRDGVDVLPIDRDGTESAGRFGCRYWSMTRYVGMSAYHFVLYGLAADQPRDRHELTRKLGTLAGSLLSRGLVHADHKASNILLDSSSPKHIWLIDAGSVRKRMSGSDAVNMLRLLASNIHHAAIHALDPSRSIVSRADRLRYWRALCQAWPDAPKVLGNLPRKW